jgi:hypothetical protein
MTTPPQDRAALVALAKNLEDYVVYHGGIHADDCHGDDTCECESQRFNDGANEACRYLAALAAAPAGDPVGEPEPSELAEWMKAHGVLKAQPTPQPSAPAISMPADRSAIIAKAIEADDSCISAGAPAAVLPRCPISLCNRTMVCPRHGDVTRAEASMAMNEQLAAVLPEPFIPIDRADMDAISPCGHYMRFRLPCVHEDGSESMSCMQCDRDAAQAKLAVLPEPVDVEALAAQEPGSEPAGPCRLDLDPEGGVTCREASTDRDTYCRHCAAEPTPIYEPMGAGEREYLHSVIAALHAIIDPEAHPAEDALANGVLLPCDEAGQCVPTPQPSAPAAVLPEPVDVEALSDEQLVELIRGYGSGEMWADPDVANGLRELQRLRAALRRVQPAAVRQEPSAWACRVRAAGKVDPPQDCDWPFCGCDEHATKVIEMLVECGWSAG